MLAEQINNHRCCFRSRVILWTKQPFRRGAMVSAAFIVVPEMNGSVSSPVYGNDQPKAELISLYYQKHTPYRKSVLGRGSVM